MPSIEEILKLPQGLDNAEQTKKNYLDKMDAEIRKQSRIQKKEMALLEKDGIEMDRMREERKKRFRENAKLRDRLHKEVGESRMRELFQKQLPFLEGIRLGDVTSTRHTAFYESVTTVTKNIN